jgi:hypothetical protein
LKIKRRYFSNQHEPLLRVSLRPLPPKGKATSNQQILSSPETFTEINMLRHLHITGPCYALDFPCSISKTMKLNCWIGPLIAVIILFTLRQMLDNTMEDEQQRSVIPAAATEKKKPELNPPMAGTRLLTDTLPF